MIPKQVVLYVKNRNKKRRKTKDNSKAKSRTQKRQKKGYDIGRSLAPLKVQDSVLFCLFATVTMVCNDRDGYDRNEKHSYDTDSNSIKNKTAIIIGS